VTHGNTRPMATFPAAECHHPLASMHALYIVASGQTMTYCISQGSVATVLK